MSFKIQAAENITDMAEAKSSGKCAAYVREAIQRAKGIKVEPTGILSAKDYGPWLVKQGYWVKGDQSITSAKPGNVIVIDAVGKHVHGHIAILCSDGRWRSDFVQKSHNSLTGVSNEELDYVLYE